MYHDEFSREAPKARTRVDEARSSRTLELGGGLSLGLAASLDPSASVLLYSLGGLLPMVTCCLSIAAERVNQLLGSLAPGLQPARPSAVPRPHLATSSSRSSVHPLIRQGQRAGSAR